MHKIYEKESFLKWNAVPERVTRFVRKHSGQIIYYACVALVLTAVAVAAERIRPDEEKEALVLPAVELSAPAPKETEPLLEVPDGMVELRAYTEHPEWNSLHGQWETHTATDFTCTEGVVRSFSEGMLKTIGKSGIYGGFVEVELNDMLLRYASIEPGEHLKVGDVIEKGEVLGMTDKSMPGEAYLNEHLHLELVHNGIYKDFAKEQKKS